MKGEMDRDCRASGGAVKKDDRKQVKKAFYSDAPTGQEPDDTLTRGKGIFRKRGGKVPPAFAKHDKMEKVEGKSKKPHLGRAGRKRGGGVGSDLKPLTSADEPMKPKDRHIMPESEATP